MQGKPSVNESANSNSKQFFYGQKQKVPKKRVLGSRFRNRFEQEPNGDNRDEFHRKFRFLCSLLFNHCGFDSPQLAAKSAIPRPLRVRHSRMLLSGIQARPELDPRLRHSGVTLGINPHRCVLIPVSLLRGS
jgi:hypothetical protein